MRKSIKTVVCALAVAMAAGPLATHADDEGVIKYRQGMMKATGGHTGALAQIMKGNVPHKAHAAQHARALADLAGQLKAAFKDETVGKSRSKDNVWSDWSGFAAKADDFQKAATALVAASGGDMADFGPRMKDLFASCKGCHKEYRAEKK